MTAWGCVGGDKEASGRWPHSSSFQLPSAPFLLCSRSITQVLSQDSDAGVLGFGQIGARLPGHCGRAIPLRVFYQEKNPKTDCKQWQIIVAIYQIGNNHKRIQVTWTQNSDCIPLGYFPRTKVLRRNPELCLVVLLSIVVLVFFWYLSVCIVG